MSKKNILTAIGIGLFAYAAIKTLISGNNNETSEDSEPTITESETSTPVENETVETPVVEQNSTTTVDDDRTVNGFDIITDFNDVANLVEVNKPVRLVKKIQGDLVIDIGNNEDLFGLFNHYFDECVRRFNKFDELVDVRLRLEKIDGDYKRPTYRIKKTIVVPAIQLVDVDDTEEISVVFNQQKYNVQASLKLVDVDDECEETFVINVPIESDLGDAIAKKVPDELNTLNYEIEAYLVEDEDEEDEDIFHLAYYHLNFSIPFYENEDDEEELDEYDQAIIEALADDEDDEEEEYNEYEQALIEAFTEEDEIADVSENESDTILGENSDKIKASVEESNDARESRPRYQTLGALHVAMIKAFPDAAEGIEIMWDALCHLSIPKEELKKILHMWAVSAEKEDRKLFDDSRVYFQQLLEKLSLEKKQEQETKD